MKNTDNFRKAIVFGLSLCASSLSLADDTDIYLAAETNGDSRSQYESNILFIIDTSGSMDGAKIGPYDPDIDYIQELDDLGIAHTCEKGKIYRQSGDQTGEPTPGKSCDQYFLYENQLTCYSAYDVAQPANLTEDGYWYGVVQQYDTDESTPDWGNLISGDVELGYPYGCQADSGTDVDDDGNVEYMADETSDDGRLGWSEDPTMEIDFTGRTDYTLFSANYLAWRNDYIRIEVLNRVFKDTINNLGTGNVGVMRFSHSSGGQGGMVIKAMDHISDSKDALNTLADTHFVVSAVDGSTPLAETMWEAYNYYSGSAVDTGNDSQPVKSVAESRVGGTLSDTHYQTPIQKACQKNHIVYLSDGEPTSDYLRDDEINALIGGTCDANNGDNCLDDLAAWMNNNDVLPGDTGAATGSQTVQTHTIGFGLDSTLLRETAQRGGGKYYSANNASALQDAFKDILREVTADSGSFTSPAVSVNAFSRLMHRNDLYFALFKPSTKSHWDGNLKKYKLKMLTGRLAIVDANDLAAINPIDSSFKADSRSFWTEPGTTDGDDVARGGAASQLALTLSDGVTPRPLTALGSGTDLAIDDTVTEGNSVSITTSLLDIVTEANADPTYHSTLLKWIKGEDVLDRDDDLDKTEPRRQLGDPLHSQPVVITYGGTDDDPDSTVYMSTNDGFLHGFDTATGAEQVAFIPADLLDIQKLAFDDTKSTGKLYGLDGGITPWVHDANGNGVIESGDHAILIVGMRRGGRNYYAIDVTDRGNPKLKWQITGGSGDFSRLGTTWSQPVLGDINVGGTKKTVLFFGGGFDQGGPDGLSEDDATPPSTHDVGNAIYIVDAETGDVIYWTSNINLTASNYEKLTGGDKMKYAIPAELAVIDSNNDGLKDQVFIGDLGGQLWRFDITNGQVGKDLVDGGVIASLGRTDPSATAADDRRFFNKPDVALINDPNYGSFLAINIGSGRRNEPTDKDIQDRFFSIWDFNVYSKPSSYSAVVSSQLHDATDNLIGQGTSAEKTAARLELDNRKGWFIDLETGTLGEKNLSSAITVDSQVLFTTYVPPGSTDPDSCEAGIGSGRFYAVKAGTGEPVNHFEVLESDEDAVPTKADRSTLLGRSGIPPAPILLFPEATGGEAVPVVGNELMNLPIRQRTRKTYWYTVED